MSAFGYKRTCSGQLANARFTPESRHSEAQERFGLKMRSLDVRLYGPVAVKAVLVGCALPVFLFFSSRVVSGSCDDVHVSCEDRINLYPAAPIRLATMLNAWTIAEVGWG